MSDYNSGEYMDECHAFVSKPIGSGPWDRVVRGIKTELGNASAMSDQIKELNMALVEARTKWLGRENELKDSVVIKKGLERKIAELTQRTLRIPPLVD